MLMEGYKDHSFQEIINKANIVAPDGRPLSVFFNIKYKLQQKRVCGMDMLPDLLKEAERRRKSVYFFGTTNELLASIKQKATTEFPELKIAGSYSPPFRELAKEETSIIIDHVRNTNPDLVLVALGCPKQEKWMAKHHQEINSCLLGLGQAFKVYAGEEKRLPKWMRNLSLEWIYRLYLEPRRLLKRYVYTNSLFLLLILKELNSDLLHRHFHFLFRSKKSLLERKKV
jgi:N-acetylglucosaminyldiphosphoundecaprenol N-acetyl-beta-D-mannosaminyltransferase